MRIAILGAGMAGLSLASLIKTRAPNVSITLFEKARGVGGRMATRRAAPFAFNHGAPYFTVRTQAFREFMAPLIAAGVIERWRGRYVRLSMDGGCLPLDTVDDTLRFTGAPNMNAIARHLAAQLAKDVEIRLNTRVEAIARTARGWQVIGDVHSKLQHEGHALGDFDWVVATFPSPQTAALFPDDFAHMAALRATNMRACFTLMLGFDAPISLGSMGYLGFEAARVEGRAIGALIVQADGRGLVAHSTHDYADARIDDDRETVAAEMTVAMYRALGKHLDKAHHRALHGWRYARAERALTDIQPPCLVDRALHLAACGDWCATDAHGGRIESAFMSAQALAGQLLGA